MELQDSRTNKKHPLHNPVQDCVGFVKTVWRFDDVPDCSEGDCVGKKLGEEQRCSLWAGLCQFVLLYDAPTHPVIPPSEMM